MAAEVGIDERKRALRAQARARRAAADPRDRADAAPRWAAHVLALADAGPGSVVAAYLSYGTEPPTGDLLRELRELGAEVLLPVLRDDLDLDWEAGGAPLGVDAVGRADLVVVPALLVARDGTRLGQGGGSYDRALVRVRPGTPLVALVHDDELVEAGTLPRDEHDVAVTHAARPGGVVALGDREIVG